MPGLLAATGATCHCTAGNGTVSAHGITALPLRIMAGAMTIADGIPMACVPTFGKCAILSAAAFSPQSCSPAFAAWVPGAVQVLFAGIPLLDQTSVLQCGVGGTIVIVQPAQFSVVY